MSRIYALTNQKGGVGKTTTAVNLSAYLAAMGQHVLIVDVDPQANATASLGVDKNRVSSSVYDTLIDDMPLVAVIQSTPHANLELAVSSPQLAGAEIELVGMRGREMKLRAALRPVRDRYDYIVVDCPPSLGLLTVNALAAAHGVIIPVQCEYLALEGLSQLMTTIQLVRRSLNPTLQVRGLVMTMYDGRANIARQVREEVEKHFAGQVFSMAVPRSVRLSEAPSYGKPILAYAPNSPGAAAYQALAQELLSSDHISNVTPPKERGAGSEISNVNPPKEWGAGSQISNVPSQDAEQVAL
jgi:chromosome partitioning protein